MARRSAVSAILKEPAKAAPLEPQANGGDADMAPGQPARSASRRLHLGDRLAKQQMKSLNLNRTLITVTVLGSPGPLRFLVGNEDTVRKVVETALKVYAREGRLPILSPDCNRFHLHQANSDSEALDFSSQVGALGIRNFLLCPRKGLTEVTTLPKTRATIATQFSHKNWWNIISSFVRSH